MNAIKVSQMAARALGTLALVLGLLVWPAGLPITMLHLLVGVLFVLAVIALAAVALGSRTSPKGAAVGLLVLGIIVAVFGMAQAGILPGDLHWIIRIVHLALGLLAMGLAEMVGARTLRAAVATA